MPFTNCQCAGMDLAAPDIVIVPPGVPVAGPNTASAATKIPAQFKMFLNTACFAHNLATKAPVSVGPAGGPGVASGMCLGPVSHMMGSTKVIIGGTPATKLGSPTMHNGPSPNAIGASIVPCQFKHMILS